MKSSCDLMRGLPRFIGITAALFTAASAAHSQNFTTIHAFATSAALNGANPDGNLVSSANTLYGTTSAGGLEGSGALFKVNLDGSGFTVIYNFRPLLPGYGAQGSYTYNADGAAPQAGLLLSGATLFGTALQGGTEGWGTVFKVNMDGSGFTNLYSFTNGIDGAAPKAVLVLSGDTLYGTTSKGGSNGLGTIFSIGSNGMGFSTLYTFSKTNTNGFNLDGASPQAGLILSNDILYGTASAGGAAGWGTVFTFNTSTLTFDTVYSFTNGTDGARPDGSLLLSDETLYGTASAGGSESNGTVFALGVGAVPGFNTLHSFSALGTNHVNSDGATPDGSLILSGSTLYGTASAGGATGNGAVFSVSLGDGQYEFTNLYSFGAVDAEGDNAGGASPRAGLILSSNALYGTAFAGGMGNGGDGAVFKVNTNGPPSSFDAVVIFPADPNGGYGPIANLIVSNKTLFGNTEHGLAGDGGGTVFMLNNDGSGFDTLFSFNDVGEGSQPTAGMILSGDELYGSTEFGGVTVNTFGAQGGVIFSLNTSDLEFTDFSISDTNAANPIGNLILSGNTLYGTGSGGLGPTSFGGVFKVNPNGAGYTLLHGFTDGSDGSYPLGGLVISGDTLYGTTGGDGFSTFGSVFSININGAAAGFTNIYVFTNGSGNGFSPFNSLVLSSNTLYGTTAFGGSNGEGTIFKVNTDTSGFTNLYTFSMTDSNAFNQDGAFPYAGLILSGHTLYGTTAAAGPAGNGTVYEVNTDGSGFQVLHSFSALDAVYSTNADGAQPYASLLLSGNALYGVTSIGGVDGGGTVFAVGLSLMPPDTLTIQLVGTNAVVTWSNPAFYLQTAATVQGPYADILGAISPYTTPATASGQFFRLKAEP